jgi:hypothetical protein
VKRDRRPVVITDAQRSPGDELRSREKRYLLMMSVRAVCLVAAAVLVSVHAPLLWLWLPICGFGMIALPWLAVILANDRPPKPKYRLVNRPRRPTAEEQPTRALSPANPPRIIDPDD